MQFASLNGVRRRVLMNQKSNVKENEKVVQANSSGIFADESGQGMVEYGLIIGLIAIICVGVLSMMGNNLYDLFFGKVRTTLTATNQ
jgi:pilus assembly protein Flp/PilA